MTTAISAERFNEELANCPQSTRLEFAYVFSHWLLSALSAASRDAGPGSSEVELASLLRSVESSSFVVLEVLCSRTPPGVARAAHLWRELTAHNTVVAWTLERSLREWYVRSSHRDGLERRISAKDVSLKQAVLVGILKSTFHRLRGVSRGFMTAADKDSFSQICQAASKVLQVVCRHDPTTDPEFRHVFVVLEHMLATFSSAPSVTATELAINEMHDAVHHVIFHATYCNHETSACSCVGH
ncbi:hypothetical protein [Roseateles noduli]|uniref:hypothetical protein n=1 Tax=Roseateles noduli TaxID=2052484 RepID=UPI003D64ED1E